MNNKRLCVTGAGGYVASWIVKLLLEKGYTIHGTVRDPDDKKYSHLNKLEGAPDNLKLFKADLLDYDSLVSAITDCAGVIHTACPVPTSALTNPEVEMLEQAIKGTLNVLKACSEAKVKKIVYISSTSALIPNPNWPKDRAKDETCFTDREYCKANEYWYNLAKAEAEIAAFEYGKQNGLDVIAVNPCYVFGPVLQPTLNFSTLLLVKFLKGVFLTIKGVEEDVPNKLWFMVDVRDVAGAVLLAYEKPDAEGRYICVAHHILIKDLVEKLKKLYPDLAYIEKFGKDDYEFWMTSEKLQKLGWTYRPLEETFVDSIECYKKTGLLG